MSKAEYDFPEAKDWRGTPIKKGDLVVYGAPVGRSISLVEAKVVGFSKTGRVNLKVIRRAYGGWGGSKQTVHVGQDRLMVVYQLPPTKVPTDREKAIDSLKNSIDRLKEQRRDFEAGKPMHHSFSVEWFDDAIQRAEDALTEAINEQD